jgi:hypothetical protein
MKWTSELIKSLLKKPPYKHLKECLQKLVSILSVFYHGSNNFFNKKNKDTSFSNMFLDIKKTFSHAKQSEKKRTKIN